MYAYSISCEHDVLSICSLCTVINYVYTTQDMMRLSCVNSTHLKDTTKQKTDTSDFPKLSYRKWSLVPINCCINETVIILTGFIVVSSLKERSSQAISDGFSNRVDATSIKLSISVRALLFRRRHLLFDLPLAAFWNFTFLGEFIRGDSS